MSGICGIVNLDGKPMVPEILEKMMDALAHRGIDGSGTWREGQTSLGHQMLHITPDSLNEELPFSDSQARLAITADARLVGLGFDQSGVNQGTPPHDQPFCPELLLQQGKQALSHLRPGQFITKPANPGFIRNRVGKGQTQKTLKRQAVADSFFQSGIGQTVPLLQQQGLKHHQRWMAGSPLSGVVERFQNLLEGAPVNLVVDLLQKMTLWHPTLGLQVPKARLSRLFAQHLRPPVLIVNRRLTRYINMLNLFF
jgi:hypothetical protein